MVKLDTMNAVLDWATCQDLNAINGEDRPTATYIAECVRLREAFDKLHHAEILGQEGFEALEELRIEAMKGEGK